MDSIKPNQNNFSFVCFCNPQIYCHHFYSWHQTVLFHFCSACLRSLFLCVTRHIFWCEHHKWALWCWCSSVILLAAMQTVQSCCCNWKLFCCSQGQTVPGNTTLLTHPKQDMTQEGVEMQNRHTHTHTHTQLYYDFFFIIHMPKCQLLRKTT